ncbi:MAG: GGDEF domain-containing protein [Acidobacteriota bacterium]
METYLFSLLVQAAGTILLFIVFVLLYQKFRRPAFLDWIASWAFFLGSIGLLALSQVDAWRKMALPVFEVALLGHIFFLLRGVWRFRKHEAVSRPVEMLWALPIVAIAWWLSTLSIPEAPVAFLRAGAYIITALAFALTPGSVGGRAILSSSFFFWAAELLVVGRGYLLYPDQSAMPPLYTSAPFVEMFLEMTVGVGIIILLFEASQSQLQSEMQRLVESDSQVKEMGIRDRLTGLYNRHYFNDVIRRELARSRRHGGALSVLLIDVDRFKEINDVRGHATGDGVLQFVANYLTACVRESDLVFRWGGDEFLVLLTQADEAAAAQKSEELANRHLPKIPGDERLRIDLSVGWATHHPNSEFPKTLAEADARMYEIKLTRKKARATQERDLGRL